MHLNLLAIACGVLAVVAKAAQEPSTTSSPPTTLLERQVAITTVLYTPCKITSGLAVPQPSGALCSVGSAPVKAQSSQLIQTYTDADITASYIACSETCLATSGCTQIFFTAGSTCSLYSGARLYAEGATTLLYFDIACFECYQSQLSTSTSGTSAASSSTTPSSSKVKFSTTTTSTSASTSSNTSSIIPAVPWTSVQTDTKSYDMALTSVFTPPPECTGSFTEIGTNYWQNAIVPAPQTTATSCYPSQFYSSAVGAANSVSLPPFNPLTCPSGWGSIPYNSTYFVCCPDGFAGRAPNLSDTQRPLSGALCYSLVVSGMFVDVTSYDSLGSTTVFPWKAGSNGGYLWATGFDGFTGVAISTTSDLVTSTKSVSVATFISSGGAVRYR